jgi:hypothetical protein
MVTQSGKTWKVLAASIVLLGVSASAGSPALAATGAQAEVDCTGGAVTDLVGATHRQTLGEVGRAPHPGNVSCVVTTTEAMTLQLFGYLDAEDRNFGWTLDEATFTEPVGPLTGDGTAGQVMTPKIDLPVGTSTLRLYKLATPDPLFDFYHLEPAATAEPSPSPSPSSTTTTDSTTASTVTLTEAQFGTVEAALAALVFFAAAQSVMAWRSGRG